MRSPGELAALALALAAAVLVSCGGGSPPGPPLPGPAGYRPCALGTRVGGFKVDLAESFTSVSGSVAAGVVPMEVRRLVEERDGCRLLQRRTLHCSPACESQMTCAEEGRCIPYPDNLDAGAVTVDGLAKTVRMTAHPQGRHYFDNSLPHPGFRAGADVRLTGAGSRAVAAFALRGWGVSALDVPPQMPVLESGRPLRLVWVPGPPGPARVEVSINIDQHGNTPSTLTCDAADAAGELTVPGELVASLIAAGVSGYPKALLGRVTTDSTSLAPGCVDLVVSARTERALAVAGHTPCKSDSDCPPPTKCVAGLETCR
jgi:hypothetical protein